MYSYENRKLSIQLVPKTSWRVNLRSILANWSEISASVRSKCRCDICGELLRPDELHAHEVWKYDDNTHTQSLENIISICELCHLSVHMGQANTQGKGDIAKEWYQTVNKLSIGEMKEDIKCAFSVWKERSKYRWNTDLNELLITTEHITGIKPIRADEDKEENGRYYTNILYKEKDIAKTYGAKFDGSKRMWYFLKKEDISAWKQYKQIKENKNTAN